jgi:hypothetical protein
MEPAHWVALDLSSACLPGAQFIRSRLWQEMTMMMWNDKTTGRWQGRARGAGTSGEIGV